MKIRRFRESLDFPIRFRLSTHRPINYIDLVETAKTIEKGLIESRERQDQNKRSRTESFQSRRPESRGPFENSQRYQSKGRSMGGNFQNKALTGSQASVPRPQQSFQRRSTQGVQRTEQSQGIEERRCYVCNENGHIARNCPLNVTRTSVTCFSCGQEGHISPNCPTKMRGTESLGSVILGERGTQAAPAGRSIDKGKNIVSGSGSQGGSRAPGRVYMMTQKDIPENPDEVAGIFFYFE